MRAREPHCGYVAAYFGELERSEELRSFSVDLLGILGKADSELDMDHNNPGTIIRFVIEDTTREMLPNTDRIVQAGALVESERMRTGHVVLAVLDDWLYQVACLAPGTLPDDLDEATECSRL